MRTHATVLGALGLALAVVTAAWAKGGEAEEVVKQYVEVWNTGDMKLADTILAADVTRTGPSWDTNAQGRESLKAYMTETRRIYPNFKVSIKDLKAESGRVVLSWLVKGTHSGADEPAAKGKKVKIPGTSIFKVAGGKIEAERASWDYLGVYEQLGVLPPPDPGIRNVAAAKAILTEVYGEGDMDLVYEIFADDHVFQVPAGQAAMRGPAAVQQRAAMFRNAFPDLTFEIGDAFGAGDLVTTRWTFYGTQGGEFLGIAPTNKKVQISGLSMTRFKDGKAVKTWGYWDTGELFDQLGVER